MKAMKFIMLTCLVFLTSCDPKQSQEVLYADHYCVKIFAWPMQNPIYLDVVNYNSEGHVRGVYFMYEFSFYNGDGRRMKIPNALCGVKLMEHTEVNSSVQDLWKTKGTFGDYLNGTAGGPEYAPALTGEDGFAYITVGYGEVDREGDGPTICQPDQSQGSTVIFKLGVPMNRNGFGIFNANCWFKITPCPGEEGQPCTADFQGVQSLSPQEGSFAVMGEEADPNEVQWRYSPMDRPNVCDVNAPPDEGWWRLNRAQEWKEDENLFGLLIYKSDPCDPFYDPNYMRTSVDAGDPYVLVVDVNDMPGVEDFGCIGMTVNGTSVPMHFRGWYGEKMRLVSSYIHACQKPQDAGIYTDYNDNYHYVIYLPEGRFVPVWPDPAMTNVIDHYLTNDPNSDLDGSGFVDMTDYAYSCGWELQ